MIEITMLFFGLVQMVYHNLSTIYYSDQLVNIPYIAITWKFKDLLQLNDHFCISQKIISQTIYVFFEQFK
ncbi:hypothetical protein pb186bvf_011342 [Paramecium bursaria]